MTAIQQIISTSTQLFWYFTFALKSVNGSKSITVQILLHAIIWIHNVCYNHKKDRWITFVCANDSLWNVVITWWCFFPMSAKSYTLFAGYWILLVNRKYKGQWPPWLIICYDTSNSLVLCPNRSPIHGWGDGWVGGQTRTTPTPTPTPR